MNNFNNLLEQLNTTTTLEQLESIADTFQSDINDGTFTMLNTKLFNKNYWVNKDRLITDEYYNKNKGTKEGNNKDNKYSELLSIISSAPVKIKEDSRELGNYISGILRGLKGKCV